jgi:1,4-alpha-glucan branching enzyme
LIFWFLLWKAAAAEAHLHASFFTLNSEIPFIRQNPELRPFSGEISGLHYRYLGMLSWIRDLHGSLREFACLHKEHGFQRNEQENGWIFREWAPEASALWLTGDFNNWNADSHPLERIDGGLWEIRFPDSAGEKPAHGQRVKVRVRGLHGEIRDRIPSLIRAQVQDPETKDFAGLVWYPEENYRFRHVFSRNPEEPLFIYEAHPGMAREEEGIGSFRQFTAEMLPRIKKAGYNCIQLMAVQEHPYYASFGYHVSGFYSVSSRFGSPEDLKELVDTAHGMGMAVIMDLVHSHSVKNINEGLNEFDGSGHQYFRYGDAGNHPLWDSKIFDYRKPEVLRFLLSNVRYWLEEYRFDGFRFDGVTSMLYKDHGAGRRFDSLDSYYGNVLDEDAVLYLKLANEVAHECLSGCISIAEDVSGLPGIARPQQEGGMGFDFRLGMGIPDYWIKIIKEQADENWSMQDLWSMLTNRRYQEGTIAYAESHDQALVGDKTLAFRLMDAEMYTGMSKLSHSLIIDRGIALHKLIRLITSAAAGDGYLNFMGNEFGHPEWIDFPREGNNWSYHYARRQWSLAEQDHLRYHFLLDFDHEMLQLLKGQKVLTHKYAELIHLHEEDKVLAFMRGKLFFVFNFHPQNSYRDYGLKLPFAASWSVLMNSDDAAFGGFDRNRKEQEIRSLENHQIRLYLTNRTAMVLKPLNEY